MLKAKVGSFQATTDVATTVIQVRSVGFQPKVVLFWWCGRDGDVDASGEDDIRQGFGWMTGASSRHCVTVSSDHGQAVGECDKTKRNDACIATIAIGTGDPQAIEGLWDFSAWNADGFDLVVDDAFATAFRVQYLALGGDDVEQVATGAFTSPASATTLDVQPGFRPDLVLIISEGTVNDNTVAVDGTFMLGMFSGLAAAENGVLTAFSDDGPTTSDTATYCKSGECLAVANSPTSTAIRASLNGYLSDGFQLTFAESVARGFYYLAIKGPSVRVGTMLTQTGAAGTTTVSVGFEPRALMFLSACRVDDTSDTPSAHFTVSIGAATSPSARLAMVAQDKDSIGTMDCFTALEFDEVYINPSVAVTMAVEGLMDINTITGDAFQAIMDDADPAQSQVLYVAIGDEAPVLRRRVKLWL